MYTLGGLATRSSWFQKDPQPLLASEGTVHKTWTFGGKSGLAKGSAQTLAFCRRTQRINFPRKGAAESLEIEVSVQNWR